MIGDRLAMLRNEKKLTMRAIGALVGVSDAAWVKYEKNRAEPSIATLCKTAELFGVSLDFLMGRTNIRDPQIVDKANFQNVFLREFEEATIGDPSEFYRLFESLSAVMQLMKDKEVSEPEAQVLLGTISDIVTYFNDLHSMKKQHKDLTRYVFDIHSKLCADTFRNLHHLLAFVYVPEDKETDS